MTRWPQNAGFLEGYLWATRQLQLDSRAFAPLRRDEQRAWQRAPGARDAYIQVVLDRSPASIDNFFARFSAKPRAPG